MVQEFLGAEVAGLPAVSHELLPHRLVDADIALARIGAEGEFDQFGGSY